MTIQYKILLTCHKQSLLEVLSIISGAVLGFNFDYEKNKYQITFINLETHRVQYFTIQDANCGGVKPEIKFKFKKKTLVTLIKKFDTDNIALLLDSEVFEQEQQVHIYGVKDGVLLSPFYAMPVTIEGTTNEN